MLPLTRVVIELGLQAHPAEAITKLIHCRNNDTIHKIWQRNICSVRNTFRSYTLLEMKMLNHATQTPSTSVHKILHSPGTEPQNSTLERIRSMKNDFT
jgi:hypothetical protein